MTKTTIRLATPEDKQAWDTYVYNHRDANPYQLFAWGEAVETAYGHKTIYLMAQTNNKVSGVFPLVLFKVPFISKKIISLPFCDVGDVLADDDEIYNKLLDRAISIVREKGCSALELRTSRELPPNLIENKCFFQEQNDKVRMILKLPSSSEELWKSFKSKLRSQIRKAEKNGLVFQWGSRKNIDDFYSVFSKNMHDLGSPVHSKKWIQEISQKYGSNLKIGIVYSTTKPVGCGIILCTKNNISIPWASTLKEFNYLSPNMMLYWNFLKYSSKRGCALFDFGRSTIGKGTYKFKKQWGAVPKKISWYQNNGEVKEEKNEKVSTYRMYLENLWKRFPLTVANLFGPTIRKYISL